MCCLQNNLPDKENTLGEPCGQEDEVPDYLDLIGSEDIGHWDFSKDNDFHEEVALLRPRSSWSSYTYNFGCYGKGRRQNTPATALRHRSISGPTYSELPRPPEGAGAFQGLLATTSWGQKLAIFLLTHTHYQVID